ncbi:hypothetical protein J6590_073539 [Homalodisca vitripennis]|nr:hypothetical protein J6590_073539 [Homalodisca vitripennis]
MKRIKSIGTSIALKAAYHALFESHVRYGITLWGSSSAGNLHCVRVLQKRVMRIMAGLQPQESCREAFKSFEILTVVSIYIIEETILMSLYTSGRSEQNFPDAERFWPTRWLRNEAGKYPGVTEATASLPFAMGGRACIGRKVADTLMSLTLAQVCESSVDFSFCLVQYLRSDRRWNTKTTKTYSVAESTV